MGVREEKMEVDQVVTFFGIFELEAQGLLDQKEDLIDLLPAGAYFRPTDGDLQFVTNKSFSAILTSVRELRKKIFTQAELLAERVGDCLKKNTGSRGLWVPDDPDFFEKGFYLEISPQAFIRRGLTFETTNIPPDYHGEMLPAFGAGSIFLIKDGDEWIARHRWVELSPAEAAAPGRFDCRSDRYGYISCEDCPKYQPKQLGIYCCQMPSAAVHAHDRVVAWDKYGNQNDIEDEDLELFDWIRPVA